MAFRKGYFYVDYGYYNNQIEISYNCEDIPEWHAFYNMDEENSKRFIDELQKKYKGSLEEMVAAAFGEDFDDNRFSEFCEDNGIKYEYSNRVIV